MIPTLITAQPLGLLALRRTSLDATEAITAAFDMKPSAATAARAAGPCTSGRKARRIAKPRCNPAHHKARNHRATVAKNVTRLLLSP